MDKIDRTNETNVSNEGYEMKIVKYNNNCDIMVEFQDEYKTRIHTSYQAFKKGEVKNPYYLSVYNVGYVGVGQYKVNENSKNTKTYQTWKSMLRRCYDPYELNKKPTYIDCYVHKEWHNFQTFAKWYEENYYEVNNERMNLDKDILCKGNKIYSPSTCIFVPQKINTLFTKSNKIRGKYPIGVNWDKDKNKFKAQCSIFKNGRNKQIHIGYFNSLLEAFNAYKQFKESYIKEIADEYKDLIPNELYKAMYNWKVEIGD